MVTFRNESISICKSSKILTINFEAVHHKTSCGDRGRGTVTTRRSQEEGQPLSSYCSSILRNMVKWNQGKEIINNSRLAVVLLSFRFLCALSPKPRPASIPLLIKKNNKHQKKKPTKLLLSAFCRRSRFVFFFFLHNHKITRDTGNLSNQAHNSEWLLLEFVPLIDQQVELFEGKSPADELSHRSSLRTSIQHSTIQEAIFDGVYEF